MVLIHALALGISITGAGGGVESEVNSHSFDIFVLLAVNFLLQKYELFLKEE